MSLTPPSAIDFDRDKKIPPMLKGANAVKEYLKCKNGNKS
jgi:hypothetical protein